MPELADRYEVEEFDPELAIAVADLEEVSTGGHGDEVLPPLETALTETDERAARADLRRQIAHLEAELARLFGSAFPRTGIEWGVAAPGGPRVLGVADLEAVRDSLADRLAEARGELHSRAYVEEKHRELIEEMVADPAAHKWARVSNEAIGEPGCRHWHSRPRWGPLGMLLGWWRVKLSSGCPLAKGHGPRAAPPTRKTDPLPPPGARSHSRSSSSSWRSSFWSAVSSFPRLAAR
ncbi:MAG: hypothetical protein ACXWD7_04275 [Solirubrobacterales bacterium]